MKLLVVCTTDSMIWNFLIPHVRHWQNQGHSVDLACSRTGFYFEKLQAMGFSMREVPFVRNPFNKRNVTAYRRLKQIIAQGRYDCVISQEPVGGALGRMAGRAIGVKNIYTAHGFHFFKGAPLKNWLLFYPVEKYLARYTDALITINSEDYEIARRFRAARTEKIDGIGVDLSKFKRRTMQDRKAAREALGIGDDCFAVVTVAELIPRKNYATALKALARCHTGNFVYLVCGDGAQEKELPLEADALGIGDRVRFLGFRRDVDRIYRVADVFLFPSYQEGLSIALIEAMATGVPILCSDIRGNRDLIADKRGGLLYSPTDVDGFAEGLDYIAANDTSAFVEYNCNEVKKYSVERSVEAFYAIIEDVCGRPENE